MIAIKSVCGKWVKLFGHFFGQTSIQIQFRPELSTDLESGTRKSKCITCELYSYQYHVVLYPRHSLLVDVGSF
jgi:hypothetical protein